MDNPGEPAPRKKGSTWTNGDRKRPLECVREFQLQRQFPSTVKEALRSGTGIAEPFAWDLTYAGNAKVSSNVETNGIPYNLQKLRILSPKGRDLGEFNVELKSTDPSKRNTITITKSNFKLIDKPLTLPLSPASPAKALPRILKQSKRSNAATAISCSRRISWSDNNSVSHEQRSPILPVNKIPLSDQESEMEKQTCNSNRFNIDQTLSTDGVSSKRSVCRTIDSSNQKYLVHHGTGDTDVRNCTKVQETAAKNNGVSLTTETSLRKENVKPVCPANCDRTSSSNKNKIPLSGKSLNVSKGKCIVTIKNTENGKVVMSLKSAGNLVQRYNQIDKNLDHGSLYDDGRKNFSNDKDNSLQTKSDVVPKSQVPEMKTYNVMTIIPNKTLSFNQSAVLTQENNTPVASANVKNTAIVTDHGTKCDNMQSKDSKTEFLNDDLVVIDDHVRHIPEPQRIADVANVQSDIQNKSLPQNDLSDRLNIIKKAMDSVKDNELRELALKALADCGIGIERYVPIRPPEDHKAVHDTQVQTLVFGLLDPKSFILINKDLENIHRLNQITLYNMPEESLLANNLDSNNLESKDPNAIERESSPFDLDSFMEQFWKENSDTLKMKETLSMTRVRCNSLLEHLQKDFEYIKRYDQKGMLNIHNAVISDNAYLVRRQLMVLKLCKQSIDILTADGRTSLELAIKYDVCSKIVQLLLDAGAQPVIPIPIHESAVIIASKQSSPLLSMLVNRVSDSKLLDQIDSDGLAAIHYCSIHGNTHGVKTLISGGATIDLKDMKSGRTSLFHAIDNGHTSVMQVLLKAGAVANIANYAGQTPLSIIADSKSIAFKMSLRKDIT